MMDSGSNMKSDAQTLRRHALYMARFVEEYAKEGLKIGAIHPQNEPGYAPGPLDPVALHQLHEDLPGADASRSETSPPRSGAGPCRRIPDDTNIAKATAIDAAALKYVKGFGVQWNLQAAVATLAQRDRHADGAQLRQLQLRRALLGQEPVQRQTCRRTITLYGEESWQLIRDWIVSGVNSYNAWNMVLDTVGKSLDNWPQNALLVVDRTAKKLIVTPAYYAFRHYSAVHRAWERRASAPAAATTRSPSRTPTAASSCRSTTRAPRRRR